MLCYLTWSGVSIRQDLHLLFWRLCLQIVYSHDPDSAVLSKHHEAATDLALMYAVLPLFVFYACCSLWTGLLGFWWYSNGKTCVAPRSVSLLCVGYCQITVEQLSALACRCSESFSFIIAMVLESPSSVMACCCLSTLHAWNWDCLLDLLFVP